jgi:Zn-dependent protease
VPGIFIVVVVWAFGVIGASALMHELGHAWTARAVGWKVVGLRWSWYGVVLVADTNGKREETWKVALGGPVATSVLALGFLAGTGLPEPISAFFGLGFAFNIVILLTNLLPVRSFDGGQIVGGLRESRFMRSGSGRP